MLVEPVNVSTLLKVVAGLITAGVTGYRCQTMAKWLRAIDAVAGLSRETVRDRGVKWYSFGTIGQMYADVFREMSAAALAGRFPLTGWGQ